MKENKTKNPFQLISNQEEIKTYETYIDLPDLEGHQRSLVLRLTNEKNRAYGSIFYEVEGSTSDLGNLSLSVDQFNEIVGIYPKYYVSTCPDTNRQFLVQVGKDNNIIELTKESIVKIKNISQTG